MLDQILLLVKGISVTVQTFVDYPHTYGNIPNIVFFALIGVWIQSLIIVISTVVFAKGAWRCI